MLFQRNSDGEVSSWKREFQKLLLTVTILYFGILCDVYGWRRSSNVSCSLFLSSREKCLLVFCITLCNQIKSEKDSIWESLKCILDMGSWKWYIYMSYTNRATNIKIEPVLKVFSQNWIYYYWVAINTFWISQLKDTFFFFFF